MRRVRKSIKSRCASKFVRKNSSDGESVHTNAYLKIGREMLKTTGGRSSMDQILEYNKKFILDALKIYIFRQRGQYRSHQWVIFDENKKKVVGSGEIYEHDDKIFTVVNSAIAPSHQRRGLYSGVLKLFRNIFKAKILSDKTRSRAASRVWRKMEKQGIAKMRKSKNRYQMLNPRYRKSS